MEDVLALIRYSQSWCCSCKLLGQRQVTCKSTDDNPTIMQSQWQIRASATPLRMNAWRSSASRIMLLRGVSE